MQLSQHDPALQGGNKLGGEVFGRYIRMNLSLFLPGFKSGYNPVVPNPNRLDGMFPEEQVAVICLNSGVLYGLQNLFNKSYQLIYIKS